MSYSKGVCQHCGGHIEFPSEGIGQTIPCPHCKWNTVLSASQKPSIEVGGGAAFRKRIFLGLGVVSLIVVGAGVGAYFWLNRVPAETQPSSATPPVVATAPAPPPKPVPPPDPWHGLKAGAVSLEKSADGRLIYAVGTVRNNSDHERFGVKVDLDVLDQHNEKIGSATDYAQILEPGKEWKFRALVTDRKASKAKLADIKEEN
ncbi:MAG TPA: FxLYD domain-containing protein [Verrucomicrobiae bacterium]